jgi:3-hydroxyacyl-CoA dehydrogenase
MGHGFALVFAAKGYTVYLNDTGPDILKKAMASIGDKIDIFVANGLIKKGE